MKTIFIFSTVLFSHLSFAETDIEVPVFPGAVIGYSDWMESSDPAILMKQVELTSESEPEKILEFYKNIPAVKSCEKNNTADNYQCRLKTSETIKSGYIFIDEKQKKGKTNIFMDYFYFKNNQFK